MHYILAMAFNTDKRLRKFIILLVGLNVFHGNSSTRIFVYL